MNMELSKINGLYIPGDSKSLVTSGNNFGYTKAVQKILKWSQLHNEKEANHFPILGVGYGFLSILKSQIFDDKEFTQVSAGGKQQLNLVHDPKHTFLFDNYEKADLEDTLDKIKFFSDLELGMSMEEMILEHKTLSSIFMPVCTFDDSSKENQNKELVSALEGIIYPWFGVGYRVDRIQYSFENSAKDGVDHSREAILHAQKLANLFVDEARLSGNMYDFVSQEADALRILLQSDSHLAEVPLVQSQDDLTIRTELYLF